MRPLRLVEASQALEASQDNEARQASQPSQDSEASQPAGHDSGLLQVQEDAGTSGNCGH